MASFNLNGLVTSFLPSVYINKITLEGASGALNKIAANREAAIDAHIDKRASGTGGYTGSPTEDDFTQANKLIVTYNLLLETQDLFDEIGDFVDDIFKFLKVHIITFKNEKGKAAYQHFISKKNLSNFPGISAGELLSHLDTKKTLSGDPEWPFYSNTQLLSGEDFKFTSQALDNIIESSGNTSAPAHLGLQNKRDFIKEKYKHVLPGGRVIYKIPIQIKQEIPGTAFPSDLAAIAMCKLDMSSVVDELEDATGEDFFHTEDDYGRVASSVIIKDSAVPKQGMVFFISTDQDNDKFDKIMGTLWMGGVHKHGDRFMAGNVHVSGQDHPYLDYVMIDNNSVQDFRQVAEIKKQIFNFEQQKSIVFGGNYVNNQLHQVAAADFSNLSCFGDLITSVNTKRQAKLLFSIDWGKIVKKNCAIPALLDKMSNINGGAKATEFLAQNGVPIIKSLKIYRQRVDVPASNDPINNTGRKLIYDGYPNIFYTGQMGNADIQEGEEFVVEYNPEAKSALSPVILEDSILKGSANSSHVSYYTFTDYDIKSISRGAFKYSMEVEIEDPTLNYFINSYAKVNFAINKIKPMLTFVNGQYATTPLAQEQFFNSQTGQFSNFAIQIFKACFWDDLVSSDIISDAAMAVMNFAMLAQNKPATNISNLTSLLSITNGTPESFNTFSEILILVADKMKSVIDSYSTAPIPKTWGSYYPIEKSLGGQVVTGGEIRAIKVEHVFKKPTELVTTTHVDAGYEYLAGTIKSPLPNQTTAEIGLKAILSSNYIARSLNEFNQYFPNFNNGPLVMPVKIPAYNGPQSDQQLNLNLMPQIGMHLKVPNGATHLPSYIVDHQNNDENEYWMVVNNILRYKLDLYGDTGNNHSLGYGPNDVIDGNTGIGPQMERILKEYQTLAYKGVYFPQASIISPHTIADPAASKKKIIGDIPGAPNDQFSWDSLENSPLPPEVAFENLENTMPSDQIIKTMQVPWAENYGQEKLLLALINGTFIAPTVLDAKLGSFDPMLVKSTLYKHVNAIYNNMFYGMPQGAAANHSIALAATAAALQQLPYQALALIANLNLESRVALENFVSPGAENKINPDFRYYLHGGNPQLYEKPQGILPSSEEIQNQDLKIDRFGQFWFNHMNVVEVQYLAGYEGVKNAPKPVSNGNPGEKRYEEVFNAALGAPIWEPLTVSKLNAINIAVDQATAKGSSIHLLCRLVKRRYDMFNTKAYDALDMPLYDEHFLLTTQHQVENFAGNAYVTGFPDNTIAAGSPGLQMEDVGPVASPVAPAGFFDPEDTSGGNFSAGVPDGIPGGDFDL